MFNPHVTVHRVIFWSFVLTLFTLICLIWKKFGGNWLQYNVCPSWTWMLVNSKCIINLFLFKWKARIIHVESKREHKYVPVSLNMSEIIGSSKYAQSDSCTKMKTLCEKASFLPENNWKLQNLMLRDNAFKEYMDIWIASSKLEVILTPKCYIPTSFLVISYCDLQYGIDHEFTNCQGL